MLKVLGRTTSANVQAVMWAIAELGLEHQREDVGGPFGGTTTPDYLAMNPNGLVPTVIDGDGEPMWESAAIVRFLACKYGDEAFWPRDPDHRARLDKWAEWIKTSFAPVLINRLFIQLIRTAPAMQDKADIAKASEQLKSMAKMLEARIGAGPWLDGDRFTFGDILCGHVLYRYFTMDFERTETPLLEAYYQRLQERPAFAKHVMVSFEGMKVTS